MKSSKREPEQPSLLAIRYNREQFEQAEIPNLNDWSPQQDGVNVLLIGGFQQEGITEVGQKLGLHRLTVEDLFQTRTRNKLEEYPDYFLFIMRLPYLDAEQHVQSEQLSFILKDNLLAGFSESDKPDLGPLIDRLQRGSVLRAKDTDDLLAAILDVFVNEFFGIYDGLADQLDDLEDCIVRQPGPEQLEALHALKKDLIRLRQMLWPLRESISNLAQSYISQVDGDTLYYMRDVEDHVVQLIQLGETYQEIATSLVDSYLSAIGNRTNEVMKVLTVFASIFIPLTFLAGVYGMNFRYMPELTQRWGYPMFWVISLIIIVVLLRYFRNKKWI